MQRNYSKTREAHEKLRKYGKRSEAQYNRREYRNAQ